MSGEPPEGLESLPAEKQVVWFREHPTLMMTMQEWDRYYSSSVQHRGQCCWSCMDDRDAGYADDPENCCCIALRPSRGRTESPMSAPLPKDDEQ